MSLNLSDIFEVVLISAIEAQFNANKYSAELAERQKNKDRQDKIINADKKINAAPYFPIPNSNFQNIGVNFKVKLEDIAPDIQRSQIKIFNILKGKLEANLPSLTLINAFVKPKRLAREFTKYKSCNTTDLLDKSIQYYALYLHSFWNKLSQKDLPSNPDFQDLVTVEADVFNEINSPDFYEKKNIYQNKEFRDIHDALVVMAANTTLLKNIRMTIADQAKEEEITASIEMKVDMRTFNWENYGSE